jgi:hypothetical protein
VVSNTIATQLSVKGDLLSCQKRPTVNLTKLQVSAAHWLLKFLQQNKLQISAAYMDFLQKNKLQISAAYWLRDNKVALLERTDGMVRFLEGTTPALINVFS